MGSEARSSLTREARKILRREISGLMSFSKGTPPLREGDFFAITADGQGPRPYYSILVGRATLCALALNPALISRSAAVDRQRRRSDRNRELAELRWCDRILAVRQANREANPTGVHPGKLPQR